MKYNRSEVAIEDVGCLVPVFRVQLGMGVFFNQPSVPIGKNETLNQFDNEETESPASLWQHGTRDGKCCTWWSLGSALFTPKMVLLQGARDLRLAILHQSHQERQRLQQRRFMGGSALDICNLSGACYLHNEPLSSTGVSSTPAPFLATLLPLLSWPKKA